MWVQRCTQQPGFCDWQESRSYHGRGTDEIWNGKQSDHLVGCARPQGLYSKHDIRFASHSLLEAHRGPTCACVLTSERTNCRLLTGAAQADVAILVVNSTRGEFETGFDAGGQTREHAMLIRSLGAAVTIFFHTNSTASVFKSTVPACEVMHEMSCRCIAVMRCCQQDGHRGMGWGPIQGNYEEVRRFPQTDGLQGKRYCLRTVQWAEWWESDEASDRAQACCLVQWNVPHPANRWVKSKLLTELELCHVVDWPHFALIPDKFKPPERPVEKPLRMCVADVFKGMGSGLSVSGTIQAGSVHPGDRVVVMPQGEIAVVKSNVQLFCSVFSKVTPAFVFFLRNCWQKTLVFAGVLIDEVLAQYGFAGDNATVVLTNIEATNIGIGMWVEICFCNLVKRWCSAVVVALCINSVFSWYCLILLKRLSSFSTVEFTRSCDVPSQRPCSLQGAYSVIQHTQFPPRPGCEPGSSSSTLKFPLQKAFRSVANLAYVPHNLWSYRLFLHPFFFLLFVIRLSVLNLQVVFHYQSLSEPAHVRKLVCQLQKNTGEVVRNKPRWGQTATSTT